MRLCCDLAVRTTPRELLGEVVRWEGHTVMGASGESSRLVLRGSQGALLLYSFRGSPSAFRGPRGLALRILHDGRSAPLLGLLTDVDALFLGASNDGVLQYDGAVYRVAAGALEADLVQFVLVRRLGSDRTP